MLNTEAALSWRRGSKRVLAWRSLTIRRINGTGLDEVLVLCLDIQRDLYI
jgi:hypothetical protein